MGRSIMGSEIETNLAGAQTTNPPAFRKAALIVNARARSGERILQLAERRLRRLGVPVEIAREFHDPSQLREGVEYALTENCDLVILAGGDGTVSAAVDSLAHHHVALGLLPVGTANDFARALDIPFKLEPACETIAGGTLVDVDLGLVGDNYYVNLASVGLSAEVARSVSQQLKRRLGPLAYPVAAARAALEYRPFIARIEFPDGDHEVVEIRSALQVGVGNGRFYGGGMVVAPNAGLDDGTLDVYAVEHGHWAQLLKVLRHLPTGHFVNSPLVHHYRTRHARIETVPSLPINVDGELIGSAPQTFSLATNALRVLVPPGSGAARLDRQRE